MKMTMRLSESFRLQEMSLRSRCPVRNTLNTHVSRLHVLKLLCVKCVCFSVIKYRVTICTGNVSGSGTDASVFLNIIGDLGDTGERLMFMSKNNVNKFEKGNVSAKWNQMLILFILNCPVSSRLSVSPSSTMSFSLSL